MVESRVSKLRHHEDGLYIIFWCTGDDEGEVEPYFYKRERDALSLDSSSECICEARVPEVGDATQQMHFHFVCLHEGTPACLGRLHAQDWSLARA